MFKRAKIIKFVDLHKKQIIFALFAFIYCFFDKSEVYKSVAPVVVAEGVKTAKVGLEAAKAAKAAKAAGDTATMVKEGAKAAHNINTAVQTAKDVKEELKDDDNKVKNSVMTTAGIAQGYKDIKENSKIVSKVNTSNRNNNMPRNTNPNPEAFTHQDTIDSGIDNKNKGILGGLLGNIKNNNKNDKSNNINNNDEDEGNVVLIEDTNIIKQVNPKITIGCILVLPLVLLIFLITLLVGGGLSTKNVMDTLDCDITNSENCERDESGSLINKFKNLFKYGSFGSNSEVISDKVSEVYEKIYDEYNFSIDMPLLISTLTVDLTSDASNIDKNGSIEVSDEMMNRLKYVEELAEMQMVEGNSVYLCEETEVDGELKYYETVYNGDVSTIQTVGGTCNSSNVGNYISRIEAQYNEDEYFENLKENVIMDALYPNYVDDKDTIINKIKMQYDLYKLLYVNESDVGNIPTYLITDPNVNLSMPLKGSVSITSPFGNRTGAFAGFHNGIDVVSNDKTIYSAGDGIVTRANYESTGGYVIEITHTDSEGRKYISLYGHIRENGFLVKVGDTVKSGDPIAIMGSTGVASGVHLHFSFWDASTNRDYMNPKNLFMEATNY